VADEISAEKIDLYPTYITAWKPGSFDRNQKVSVLYCAHIVNFMIYLNFTAPLFPGFFCIFKLYFKFVSVAIRAKLHPDYPKGGGHGQYADLARCAGRGKRETLLHRDVIDGG
jgi:hypothetical protein